MIRLNEADWSKARKHRGTAMEEATRKTDDGMWEYLYRVQGIDNLYIIVDQYTCSHQTYKVVDGDENLLRWEDTLTEAVWWIQEIERR